MILEIQHETCFDYTEPVRESVIEVRMQPVSDLHQTCHSFHLNLMPTTQQSWYQDGFGNSVHHFNMLSPHDEVRILAASVVETHPRPHCLEDSQATWPMNLDDGSFGALDFLRFRGPVRPTPRLEPLVEELQPREGMALGQLILAVGNYIHTHYEYARDVTLASSPLDHLLEEGKGVCQDFTHLMIGLLRTLKVPARYVSGYIHRPNKESQSHAWCEAWVPDLGWVGMDPTNDCLVHDHFVKVAVGRDFSDVPPNKGVYRGRGEESISVRVESRELERLPSLSWRQQLPALNVPLTAVAGRKSLTPMQIDEGSDQQ
jgi:transglutaminase-like putative cysteine protease